MLLLNWLSRTLAFSYRNYIFAKRNLFFVFEILFWPVIGLISLGLMSKFLVLDQNMKSFLLTGTITMGVLQVSQLDVAYSLLYDVWSKSIKHTFLAPVSIGNFIFGSWLIGIARGVIVFFVLSLLARWLFGFSLPSFTTVVIFFLGIIFSALIIGMSVCTLVLLFGQRIEVAAWSISTLTTLLCGIYYPVSIFPPTIYFIARLIPLTYFLEYFRKEYSIVTVSHLTLIPGIALTLGYFVLLYLSLSYVINRARKTGMLLRLSE